MPTANLGIGSGLTSTLGTGTGTANLGTGSGLVADLKDPGAAAATYGTEYQAVYDSYTTKPDVATAIIWNTFVSGLVTTGEWSLLDVMYVLSSHINTAGEALKNWILPGTYDATAYNSPAFTVSEGFLFDGASDYVDTNYNPSTDATNYERDSASFGLYIRTNVSGVSRHGIDGSADSKDCRICPNSSGNVWFEINEKTYETVSVTGGSGMIIATRTASNVKKLYRNKSLRTTKTTASIGIPTSSFFIGASNNDGAPAYFRPDQVSLAFMGGGLEQANVDNITDAFEVAMDALGKGVIA